MQALRIKILDPWRAARSCHTYDGTIKDIVSVTHLQRPQCSCAICRCPCHRLSIRCHGSTESWHRAVTLGVKGQPQTHVACMREKTRTFWGPI